MPIAAIIAAAAAIIAALIAAGMEGEAMRKREEMAAEFGEDILPDLDEAVAQEAGPSAFEGVTEQGDTRRAQLEALSALDDEYQSGGQSAADMAAYTVAGRKVSQRAGQRAGDIQLESARRGQSGSGLASVLAAQSGQSELEALAGLSADVAASGRDRGLRALGMKGELASGIRSADWRAKETKANATDMMNRFNASQRMAAEMRNAGLKQQQFDNIMALKNGKNAAVAGVAAATERNAAGVRATGAGVGNAAVSYGSAWDARDDNDDERDY